MMSKSIADLVGKPFRYGARGPDAYDCYGLCKEIYRRRGITLPNFPSSEEVEINRMSMEVGKSFFQRIDAPAAFCIVAFMIRPPYTSHVGIVLPDLAHFMHVMEQTSVTIERLDGLLWTRRITGYYEWKN